MTNYEKIKSLSIEEMADFLRQAEVSNFVPKKFICDSLSCFECKEGLDCFIVWLNEEYKGA